MKGTIISELIGKGTLPLIASDASAADAVNMFMNEESVEQLYVVDTSNSLVGIISSRNMMEYLAPYLLTTSAHKNGELLKDLESVDLNFLIETEFQTLTVQNDFPELLQRLITSESHAVAVVDDDERIIGEVRMDQLWSRLMNREREVHHAFS